DQPSADRRMTNGRSSLDVRLVCGGELEAPAVRAFAEPQVEAVHRPPGLVAPGFLERDDHGVLEVLRNVLHVDADLARDIDDDVAAMRLAAEEQQGLADTFDEVLRRRTLRRLAAR